MKNRYYRPSRAPQQNGRGNYSVQAWNNEVAIPNEQLQSMSGDDKRAGMQGNVVLDASTMPETLTNPIYTPGMLRTMIGKWMRVEFLVGNSITDRVGLLQEVGASYIMLQSIESSSRILCDIYSIKFVTIVDNPAVSTLYNSI